MKVRSYVTLEFKVMSDVKRAYILRFFGHLLKMNEAL